MIESCMAAINQFTGQRAFLSNFYPSRIELDGEQYPTVEHAFQAAKTLDKAERKLIRQAATPAQARRLGRKVHLRSDWEPVKGRVMRSLLQQKFADPELQRMLVGTGDAELVEGNTWGDRIWGCVKVKGRWVGQNRLGQLLIEIRTSLQN